MRAYETLGSDLAAFGGPDWMASYNPQKFGKDDGNYGPEGKRNNVHGSPVVPGTAQLIHSDGEMRLYSITILKGQTECGFYEGDDFVPGKFVDYVEPFKAACREKRLTVREFIYDPAKAGGIETQITQAQWEVQQTLTTIVRYVL